MSKIPSPFKRVDDSDNAIAFEAAFDLPNDGTPSPNRLVLRVELESADDTDCYVYVIGETYRRTTIGSFKAPIASLANIVYGFGRVKQVPLFVID